MHRNGIGRLFWKRKFAAVSGGLDKDPDLVIMHWDPILFPPCIRPCPNIVKMYRMAFQICRQTPSESAEVAQGGYRDSLGRLMWSRNTYLVSIGAVSGSYQERTDKPHLVGRQFRTPGVSSADSLLMHSLCCTHPTSISVKDLRSPLSSWALADDLEISWP